MSAAGCFFNAIQCLKHFNKKIEREIERLIIKAIQERKVTSPNGLAVYCYEADSYIFLDEGGAAEQSVVIFKDGKEIFTFQNPFFKRFFICNDNGKTIDAIEFSPIKDETESEK